MHRMRTQFRSEIYYSESALKDYCLESLKHNLEYENLGHDGCTSTNLASQDNCPCKRKAFFPHPVPLTVFYDSSYLMDRQVKQQMSENHLMHWVYSVQ